MAITSTSAPTARRRPTRTRTPRVSSRPAIVISKMESAHIDLLPGTESLVCLDCRRWCPITGHDGRTPKLAPHHIGRAETGPARRCPGSNRLIDIDIDVDQWRRRFNRLLRDAMPADKRHADRQFYKPMPAPAPAIARMRPAPLSAPATLKAYRDHRRNCAACTGAVRCPGGAQLAKLYEQLKRQQPRRDRVQAIIARERARFDRRYVETAAKQAATEWAMHLEATADAKALSKRSGTVIEEANNICRNRRVDKDSTLRGLAVPLQPPRLTR